MQCVVLQPKGTTRNANIPSLTTLPTAEDIAKILRRAGAPEAVGTWKWASLKLHLFGYKTGKPGTENKHELPPPYDEATLYGEAVIVATNDTGLVTFTTVSYTKFYNEATQEVSDSESDIESEGEFASEVEEAESVVKSESESESESEVEIQEEEEEEAPPPVRIPKPKRPTKKVPAWYSIPELTLSDIDTTPARQTCMKRLAVFLPMLNPEQHTELEKSIFRFCLEMAKRKHLRAVWENPEFQTIYDIQIRRVLCNLDTQSYVGNARLMNRLQEGEFQIGDVPFMTYSDLFPEKWMELADRETKREAKMLELDTSMATDMFRCSRCGKRQCTYYEQQTRSADEPMTIFIRCVNCGKQWRQ